MLCQTVINVMEKVQQIEGYQQCGSKKQAAILHKAFGAGLTNQMVHMQTLGERADRQGEKKKNTAQCLKWNMTYVFEENREVIVAEPASARQKGIRSERQ